MVQFSLTATWPPSIWAACRDNSVSRPSSGHLFGEPLVRYDLRCMFVSAELLISAANLSDPYEHHFEYFNTLPPEQNAYILKILSESIFRNGKSNAMVSKVLIDNPLLIQVMATQGEPDHLPSNLWYKLTKSRNLNVSRLVSQLSLPNPLKPGVKSRMNMQLKQRRYAMLHLHLSVQQCYYLLKCAL